MKTGKTSLRETSVINLSEQKGANSLLGCRKRFAILGLLSVAMLIYLSVFIPMSQCVVYS